MVDSLYFIEYDFSMIQIIQSNTFSKWLGSLKDREAVSRIIARLRVMSLGSMGDVKPVGDGVSEARINYGPGYRVYFVRRGDALILALGGGDKRTQQKDIAKAKQLNKEWR